MKALKIILFILLGLGALFVLLGMLGPKSWDASRTIVINASPDQVWPHVSNLRKMQEWSPWAEKDTAMIVEWSGEDGTVGSSQSWSGNKEVGKGKQTIVVLEPNKRAETELVFMEPWESTSTGFIELADTAGNTKVVWGIRGDAPFMMRPMMLFMNMDKAMAADFDHGLNKLKAAVESSKGASSAPYQITPGEYTGGKFLGVRSVVKMDAMEAFYGENLKKAMEAAEKSGAGVAGAPLGVYYSWDMEKGESDMAAAIPVQKEVKAPAGVTYFTVAPGKSLTMDYMGGYHGLYGAHNAFDEYIKANQLEHVAPVLEEYHTDPMTQPDSTKWHTRIIYLIK